nr:hypothetical protein [uncultured Allomuricauda sp.]
MAIIQRGDSTKIESKNIYLSDFSADKSFGFIHAEIIAKPLSLILKKAFYIVFTLSSLVLITGCNNKSRIQKDAGTENDEIVKNSSHNSNKKELTKYDKKWIRYEDENGITTHELELYISEFGDTLNWSQRIYKNGVLDLTKSNFYDFEAKMAKDSIIKGRITLHLELDHSIEDPLSEKELTVDFVNQLNGKKDVITFKSKNQNYVDFEFKNDNDTIIGLLTEYRQIELLKSPDSVRMIWSKLPIDSKPKTDNIFIHFDLLEKNKR